MNKHLSISRGRLVLAVFVCLFGVNNLLAQTAVLQHEGEVGMFYGPNSFVNAYNASVDGDVITLSEGNFNPCAISKSITVHGAGAYDYSDAGSFATRFTNYCVVESNPVIEGIKFGAVYLGDQSSPQFVKCNFVLVAPWEYNYSHASVFDGVCFTNCFIITLRLYIYYQGWGHYFENCQLVNSVVWNLTDFGGQDHIASNSIIRITANMPNFTSYKSIIISDSGKPTNTCSMFNCIGIKNGNGQVFVNSLNSTVVEYDNITDVFPAFVGEDVFNEEFILDEGIATGFLGNNGTEVGIHGGYYPYSSRPGYMRMQHCTVGDRTTNDGHLSVDIEVVTEEP